MLSEKFKKISLFLTIPFLLFLISTVFWQIKPKNHFSLYDFQQPEKYNQAFLLSVSDFIFSIKPLDAQAAEMIKDGDVIKYLDAYENTDIVQTKSYSRIKEEIILKKPGHPLQFKYQINLEQYDWRYDKDNNLIFFVKGKAEDELSKVFTIPAPFLIDASGEKTFDAVTMEIIDDLLIFTIDKNWLDKASYPVTLDPTVEINIINVHSSPQQGENWVVNFTTQGRTDLKIIPNDQATIDDDVFVSLSCNGEYLQPQILQGDVIFYPDWQCSGTGQVIHYTKTAGNHTLRFEFGDQVVYAYNSNPPITVVQARPATLNPYLIEWYSSGSLSFTALPSAGNLIVVVITQNYNYGTVRSVTSVTDNQGNGNYTQAVTRNTSGGYGGVWIYYKQNIKKPSGTFTVTVNFSGSTGASVGLFEVSGADKIDPCPSGNTNSNRSTGTSISSGAVNPSRNALYVGVMTGNADSFTSIDPAAGWTEKWKKLDSSDYDSVMDTEYYIGSGSQTATWTGAPSRQWVAAIAAFNQARKTEINSPRSAPPDNSGLVAYWTFDGENTTWTSATAGTTADRSGNNNTGTMTNMSRSTSPVPGVAGQAFKFDGINDIVRDSAVDLSGTAAASVSLWMYEPTTFADEDIFFEDGNSISSYDGFIFANGSSYECSPSLPLELGLSSSAGFNSRCYSAPSVKAWHHYVAIFDTSQTAANEMKLYIDGVLKSGSPGDYTDNSVGNLPNASFNIGNRYNTSYATHSILDEVRLYSRVLSASEIQELYQLGAARIKVDTSIAQAGPQSGLVGNWSFNGQDINWTSGTAGTAYDRSGSGNNLTITDMSRTTSPIPGISGQALYFDGSNDELFRTTINFSGTSAVTYSSWINYIPEPSGDYALFIESSNGSCDEANTSGCFSFFDIGGSGAGCPASKLQLQIYKTGWSANCYSRPSQGWHHFVGIWDMSQSSGNEISFYIDGVLQTPTSKASFDNSGNFASGYYFFMMWQGYLDTYHAKGTLDEARIYSRALSTPEIQELYRLGVRRLKFFPN